MKKHRFFAVLLPLFAFLLLFSACRLNTPENDPAESTAVPSETAQPEPEKLPLLSASAAIILPEDDVWCLHLKSGDANLSMLLQNLSSASVYAVEVSPGPWTQMLFFRDGVKQAVYAVNPQNVLRVETGEGVGYYRLADEKPLYDFLTVAFEEHTSQNNVNPHYLKAIQHARAREFLADGIAEARLTSFTEIYSLPVSSRYSYTVYQGTYCALPAASEPQTAPWKEYTHVFPILYDRENENAVELGPMYLPSASRPRGSDWESAFLTALEQDPANSHIWKEADPLLWLPRIQLREGSLRLVTLGGTSSDRPAVSFQEGNYWYEDLRVRIDWSECEAPPLDGRQGVEAKSVDGLSVAFYEGEVACVKTPDGERWLQGTWTEPLDSSSFLHIMGYNSVFGATRMLYYYWEHVPDGLVLKTDSADPAAVAVQLMNLWGKKLQRLSHDNPYAVKSFAASEADTSKVEGYSDDPNVYAYMVGYSLVPASSEGYNLRYDENIDENGTVHYGGLAVFQKLDNGTWVFLRFHYGAQF